MRSVSNQRYPSMLIKCLRVGLRTIPLDLVIMCCLTLIVNLLPLAMVPLLGYAVSIIRLSNPTSQYLLTFIGTVLLYCLLKFIKNSYPTLYKRYIVQFHLLLNFEKGIKSLLHKKCELISSDIFEQPIISEYLQQAKNASNHLFRLNEIIISLLCYLISLIFLSSYLVRLNPMLGIVLALGCGINMAEQMYILRVQNARLEQGRKLLRDERSSEEMISKTEFGKDRMINQIGPWLFERWRNCALKSQEHESQLNVHVTVTRAVFAPLKVLGANGGLICLLWLVSKGKLSEIDFMKSFLIYGSVETVFSQLTATVGYAKQFSAYVMPFFRFMDIPDSEMYTHKLDHSGNAIDIPNQSALKLNNVSYRYPNATKDALSHINIEINKGERIAIVGANGSGKSTLAKIILGIYKPTTGEVLCTFGEKPRPTSMFQDFCKYALSLGDNIVISDVHKPQSSTCKEPVDPGKNPFLPESIGLDTQLQTQYGGIDLSGGQWQGVAMERAFYRNSDLIVLDEPTSAIDPLRESAFYDQMSSRIGDQTAIIITHRLAAVKLADRIIVMANGRIIGDGKHNDLVHQCELYSEYWSKLEYTYS